MRARYRTRALAPDSNRSGGDIAKVAQAELAKANLGGLGDPIKDCCFYGLDAADNPALTEEGEDVDKRSDATKKAENEYVTIPYCYIASTNTRLQAS